MFYRLNIYSGFCECGKGKNCGPCKHKNAVAHHFQVSGFSVLPETDPHMRAMWHYIAFGKTLENHWYRGLHDGKETSIDVETFISERLENPSDISTEETDVFFETETEPADQNSDNESEDDDDVKETIENFKDTWKKYGERIVSKLSKERPNLEILKAVKSATKVMMKSLKSQTKTLSDQLIWFGKPQHCKKVERKSEK